METLVSIKKLSKIFPGKVALDDVSLDIRKGEILGLLGVNGAGKTTLLSVLATLYPPTSGDIEFEGRSIFDDVYAYRCSMGLCPQAPNGDDQLTVYDNLYFGGLFYGMEPVAVKARIAELSALLSLDEYLDAYPTVLSGGYKQRFMLARALIHRPKLVLLDEPTVGLDPHIRREVWSLIGSIRDAGVSVVLTTHYLEEAEVLSDRVCLLHAGRVKLIDTPEKLMADFSKKNLEEVFLELL